MSEFRIGALPRPFNLTAGMLRFSLLSLAERRGLLAVGLAIQRWTEATQHTLASRTVAEWLRGLAQSENALRSLWYPIAVSVMNEDPARASALLFARSLKATLLGKAGDSAILLPTVGQTELYVTGAEQLLGQARAQLLLNTPVQAIEIRDGRARGVRTASGELLSATTVVSAVPYHGLGRLLPPALRETVPFSNCRKFRSSPIVSVHLWFDRKVMDVDYVGLIDRTVQWLFDRRAILGPPAAGTAASETFQVSGVISGAHRVVGETSESIVATAVREVHEVFPQAARARCVASVVIKERRATFSPTNAVEPFRPDPPTPIGNLLLAGDWTNTGLPATIEGAVLSGFRAARLAQ
jgi:squalene-associated FAD-dependent desaturase